jgi:4'-phosphopantetheinyl transferase
VWSCEEFLSGQRIVQGQEIPEYSLRVKAATHSAIRPLHGNDVHVWLGLPASIQDVALLGAYATLLNAAERERQARFRFPADRHLFLVTRALLRTVLSRYAPVQPQDWQFANNSHGRPRIAGGDPSLAALNFNVSHTRDLVAVAITLAPAVGVDVEDLRAGPVDTAVANRYFAPQEALALRALPEARQGERFHEYWTLKEAYVKAQGLGLSMPLDQFSFQFEGERGLRFSVAPAWRDSARSWKFWQFQVVPHHLVAVCVGREASQPASLVCRSCTPLVSDAPFEPLAARESA